MKSLVAVLIFGLVLMTSCSHESAKTADSFENANGETVEISGYIHFNGEMQAWELICKDSVAFIDGVPDSIGKSHHSAVFNALMKVNVSITMMRGYGYRARVVEVLSLKRIN